MQILSALVLLPLGCVLIALFAGWALKPVMTQEQLAMRSPCAFDAWLWLVRLAVPLLLAIVILNIPRLFA
jgi:neurotransmitter:Na+ symporter, NSS family